MAFSSKCVAHDSYALAGAEIWLQYFSFRAETSNNFYQSTLWYGLEQYCLNIPFIQDITGGSAPAQQQQQQPTNSLFGSTTGVLHENLHVCNI